MNKKSTKRIIINYDSTITELQAMEKVMSVIMGGRISTLTRKGKEIRHFCWVTVFKTKPKKTVVYVHEKQYPTASDSFTVYHE